MHTYQQSCMESCIAQFQSHVLQVEWFRPQEAEPFNLKAGGMTPSVGDGSTTIVP